MKSTGEQFHLWKMIEDELIAVGNGRIVAAYAATWRLAISKADLNNSKPPRRDSGGESSESVSGEREFRGL